MNLIITHLTDIHIKQESDLDILMGRTSSIVGAIGETIRSSKETMLLICVTGDVAYSGTEEQYAIAELFLDDIYDKLMARYDDLDVHFAFIPGNHDCDFTDPTNTVRTTVIKSSEVNMDDAGTMELCTSIQNKYFAFVDKYVKRNLAVPIRRNSVFTENVLSNSQLGEYNIKLHCLNTAWCSSLHETKEMLFSVPDGIEKKSDKDIVITLMHHGETWFEWKSVDNWDAYHKEFSDIILVGHDHYADFVQKKNYDASSNYFIKGNQLYSTEEPEQSGFNIFKVNLQDNTEIFYTYAWNGKIYERIIDSKAQVFERNRFMKSKVSLAKDLIEYLEDLEIDITSKHKSPLLLSNVYVFPVLKGERLDNPNKVRTYRGQDSILEIIQTKKKILINGNKEYGKTALIKRLFMIFYGMEKYPLFLNVDEINSASEDRVNSLIRESYRRSYNNLNVDEVMQMESDKRVCFIDNYDDTILSDKSQKAFLEYINTQFDIVVLTANNKNSMIDTVKNLETNEFVNDTYYQLEIGKLRRYGKSRIIDRWLLLEDPDQDVKSQEFDAKRKAKLSQMQSVLKKGYFSNTPLEFLLVLSYVDNSESMNADYSRYSYIYDCLIRDKINEISNKDTSLALAYRTLLEILAYDLYVNNQYGLFEEDYLLRAIANYNENYPKLKGTSVKIIQKMVQYKIIEERNDKFKFKYNYMYYYFAGSYIVENLSHEEKEAKIIEILSDLSLQTNYNIALFMAYSMNTQFDILPKMQTICSGLLDDYKEFKYEDQRELLEKINANVLEKLNELYEIPENSEIPKIQENRQIEQDEFDEKQEKEIQEESEKRAEESMNIIFTEFTKLLRMIEFQGDILKNYGTKIKNEPRTAIIELMGGSNLKLIGFLCNRLSFEVDKIIEIVEKKAKEDGEKVPEKKLLLGLIKDFISILWSEFIELNVDNLAGCLECDLIAGDISAYKEKMQSEFFDMVNIEYKLRVSDGKLPISDIEKSLFGKRKLSSFSMNIMKHIVASYLSIYQYDSKEKERVCNILGFDYKKLFIEDQKVVALGLEEPI